MIVALLNQNGGVDKTTVTLDSVAGWSRQRLQVVVIDADRKRENENCWLDCSEQRAKEGLTRCFEVISLIPGVPRHEALEIAWIVGHVVTVGPPRFAAWTRSALLATDAALTPFQPSSPSEGSPVEIRRPLEKAWIFRLDLHPRFNVNCCEPRSLVGLERARARVKQGPPMAGSRFGGRVTFANVACSSQFAWKLQRDGYAAWADDRAHCQSHDRRTATACDRKSVVAGRPGDPGVRSRNQDDRVVDSASKPQRFTPRMPINVTHELRGASGSWRSSAGRRSPRCRAIRAREFLRT